MPNVIASQTTPATSAEFTQASNVQSTLHFSPVGPGTTLPFGAYAELQIKSAAATFLTVGVIDSEKPSFAINFPGTFRVVKYATSFAFGVDRST